jgi:hypothetical protein
MVAWSGSRVVEWSINDLSFRPKGEILVSKRSEKSLFRTTSAPVPVCDSLGKIIDKLNRSCNTIFPSNTFTQVFCACLHIVVCGGSGDGCRKSL